MVALRKESVDRNMGHRTPISMTSVALRKESVDRNNFGRLHYNVSVVALRKESVDRNTASARPSREGNLSLSARRAWIEICCGTAVIAFLSVALRKESVDRNFLVMWTLWPSTTKSLSARRAWNP